MPALSYRRAGSADSGALCDLMRETPMGRAIRVTQERDPDFFAGARVQAESPEVWGAFEKGGDGEGDGRAVGLFSAGARRVYLGGRVRRVRYLADLRIRPERRGGIVLAKGYRLLRREVFAENEWAQTLILDDNKSASDLITSRRAGLPTYHPCGTYRTWFLLPQPVSGADPDLRVRPARPTDLPAMGRLLEREGPGADFTPAVDFGAMPGVDFRLAFRGRGGGAIGLLGVWDISGFRRTRVVGYSRSLRLVRPAYNFWARLRHLPRLPRAGRTIPCRALTAVLCRDRDPAILRALLADVLQSGPDCAGALFAIGLDAEDPLAGALTGLRTRTTTARHYLVGFGGEPPIVRRPICFDFARL